MAYCVHCGVELSASERVCPLCATEVLDPRAPWRKPEQMPYPERVDPIRAKHLDRRFIASLAGLLLLIPLGISLLCDLLPDGLITWSAYVLGAIVLLFFFFVFPYFFKRGHALRFATVDCLSTLAYLYCIDLVGGAGWFVPIALPVTLMCTGFALLIIFLKFKGSDHLPFLKRVSISILAIGAMCIGIELAVDAASGSPSASMWSLYVMLPCAVLALISFLLDGKPHIKESIRKRMFF